MLIFIPHQRTIQNSYIQVTRPTPKPCTKTKGTCLPTEKFAQNAVALGVVMTSVGPKMCESINWLVVSTPLKNMKVSWDDYSQHMEKSKMFQTTNQLNI
jgi:hypothetical protein